MRGDCRFEEEEKIPKHIFGSSVVVVFGLGWFGRLERRGVVWWLMLVCAGSWIHLPSERIVHAGRGASIVLTCLAMSLKFFTPFLALSGRPSQGTNGRLE